MGDNLSPIFRIVINCQKRWCSWPFVNRALGMLWDLSRQIGNESLLYPTNLRTVGHLRLNRSPYTAEEVMPCSVSCGTLAKSLRGCARVSDIYGASNLGPTYTQESLVGGEVFPPLLASPLPPRTVSPVDLSIAPPNGSLGLKMNSFLSSSAADGSNRAR